MFYDYVGKEVSLELAGSGKLTGTLIDCGSDAAVLLQNESYVYVAIGHILQAELTEEKLSDSSPNTNAANHEGGKLKLFESLVRATGLPSQIKLDRHLSFFGTIADVTDDYFEYETFGGGRLTVPITHLKWLMPLSGGLEWPSAAPPESEQEKKEKPQTFREWLLQAQGCAVNVQPGASPGLVGYVERIGDAFLLLRLPNNRLIVQHIDHIKCVSLFP
ncbi:hypothetical protein [Paenibacillus sp. NPDC058071]|uniref:hypothetical protein n=1 Tax=Paenibacillus sp. NPDC058071 TaxID=3346326 RepID=UPI0036DEF497